MYRNLGIAVRDAYQGPLLEDSVRLQFEARGVIKSARAAGSKERCYLYFRGCAVGATCILGDIRILVFGCELPREDWTGLEFGGSSRGCHRHQPGLATSKRAKRCVRLGRGA